jgi:type IV pilus assembly protein PilV
MLTPLTPLTQPDAMHATPHRHRASNAAGFVLIEALIALLIFALAVLGLVGLQVSMTRANTSAKFRADAAFLASDLVGVLWTDAANISLFRTACATHAPCKNWDDKRAALLPTSSWTLTPDADQNANPGKYTLTITWTVPLEGQHQYVTTTSINPNS